MLAWYSRFVAFLLFSLPASAAGSVQLSFSGFVTKEQGTTVDIEIAAQGADGVQTQIVALHVALLRGTTAADLAALLDLRLGESKFRHVLPPPAGERNAATLFVDGVSRVSLRVSDGLSVRIGLTESAPTSVLLLEPLTRRGKGGISFHGTTSDARLRQRGVVDFGIELNADSNPTSAADSLATACSRANWLSERPSHETWKPSVSFEGVNLIGSSFAIDSQQADWGLELQLP
jgi:hypothetical protein